MLDVRASLERTFTAWRRLRPFRAGRRHGADRPEMKQAAN